MGKRKKEHTDSLQADDDNNHHSAHAKIKLQSPSAHETVIQIITGSYERVLHGFTATIPTPSNEFPSDSEIKVTFADTFLIQSHSSAIRCLALSASSAPVNPARPQKIILASGSSDERINLYNLSTSPPTKRSRIPPKDEAVETMVIENPKNRELGSLLHHSSSISALCFPTRSKLLSAAEDNTIAVTRTRDWTVLSTIKAPIPKALGRPSGDTAPPGGFPSGVNDFAVHPSMKLMVSVGKGEKCMRLWNLVTGKKAGVLNFGKEVLQRVGEGRWGSGEGRKVEWSSTGEEFVVGFERGAVAFEMDSKPKSRILPNPQTKIHQIRYVEPSPDGTGESDILAISTEDGRIIFFSTNPIGDSPREAADEAKGLPDSLAIAQLGGKAVGLTGRVKDFEILRLPNTERALIIIAASSDGATRLWTVITDDVSSTRKNRSASNDSRSESNGNMNLSNDATINIPKQIGRLIGTYQTGGNRITCMKAFVMCQASYETVKDSPQFVNGDSASETGVGNNRGRSGDESVSENDSE